MRRLLFWLHRFEDGLIVTVLLGMVLLAVAQIGLRNFGGVSLVWAEPLLRNAVLWIGLLGAMGDPALFDRADALLAAQRVPA